MSRYPLKRRCEDFDKNVIVTVYCKKAVALGGSGPVTTNVECSGSPNGRCGKYNTCSVLRKAEDDVRNRRF